LDALKREHGLKANYYDGVSHVIAQRKRNVYLSWCEQNGLRPLPYDGGWWKGWNEYVAAYPDWQSTEWKAAEDAAIVQWKEDNGYS
jgi:hypothetical protein